MVCSRWITLNNLYATHFIHVTIQVMALFSSSSSISALLVILLVQGVLCVRRPDYLNPYPRSDYLAKARVAPRNEEDKDSASSPRKVLYVGPNYKEPPSRQESVYTTGKCCKIGERLAKEGLHCQFDMHTATRSVNHFNRAKVILRDLSRTGNTSPSIRPSILKSLSVKATKCYHHKDMLEKCCNYRATFLSNMRKCKTMKGADRRLCRIRTKSSFGYWKGHILDGAASLGCFEPLRCCEPSVALISWNDPIRTISVTLLTNGKIFFDVLYDILRDDIVYDILNWNTWYLFNDIILKFAFQCSKALQIYCVWIQLHVAEVKTFSCSYHRQSLKIRGEIYSWI